MTCKEFAEMIAVGVKSAVQSADINATVAANDDIDGSVRIRLSSGEVFDLAVLKIRSAQRSTNKSGL